LAWTGVAKWAAQLLRWLASLVIARLLLPSDYGLVGMALVYIDLVQLVNQFGLSSAIVQNRDLDEDHVARLGGLGVLVAIVLFAVSYLLAVPVARFFGEPAVAKVVVALSVKLIIDSLGMVPRALLARDLRFGVLAWTEAASAVAMSVITLVCAYAGLGFWSLVIGVIGGSVLTLGMSFVVRPHRLAFPSRWGELRGSVRFGRDVLLASLAWYEFSNADFVIVGRVFDKMSLGLYTFAWNVASVPVEKIAALVGGVTPGVFSAVQRDIPTFRRYFLSISEALATVTMPLAVGLSIVADDFVRVVVGERWLGAVLPLRVLALLGGLRSLTALPTQVMVATGNPHLARRCSLIAAVVMPLCFLVGSYWGLAGVASGWVVGFPVLVILFDYRYTFELLDLSPREYIGALRPAISSSLGMAAVVLALEWILSTTHVTPLVRLAAMVGTGALAYFAVISLAHGDRVRAFRTVMRATQKIPAA
jgi:O-antigen/teichoic acid export membrane protein